MSPLRVEYTLHKCIFLHKCPLLLSKEVLSFKHHDLADFDTLEDSHGPASHCLHNHMVQSSVRTQNIHKHQLSENSNLVRSPKLQF